MVLVMLDLRDKSMLPPAQSLLTMVAENTDKASVQMMGGASIPITHLTPDHNIKLVVVAKDSARGSLIKQLRASIDTASPNHTLNLLFIHAKSEEQVLDLVAASTVLYVPVGWRGGVHLWDTAVAHGVPFVAFTPSSPPPSPLPALREVFFRDFSKDATVRATAAVCALAKENAEMRSKKSAAVRLNAMEHFSVRGARVVLQAAMCAGASTHLGTFKAQMAAERVLEAEGLR
jgi:hypothetical protein